MSCYVIRCVKPHYIVAFTKCQPTPIALLLLRTYTLTYAHTDRRDRYHSVLAWLDVVNDRWRCCRDNGTSVSRAHSAMPKRLESVERKNDFVFALAETDSQLTHRLIMLSSGVKLSHYSLKLSPSLCVHPRCVTS